MSNIVDLSVLIREPLIIKGLDETEYKIPGSVSTDFVIKFIHYENEAKKIKSPEDGISKLEQMVADILSLDESKKNIDANYVRTKFNDIRLLRAIVQAFSSHLQNIVNDPN